MHPICKVWQLMRTMLQRSTLTGGTTKMSEGELKKQIVDPLIGEGIVLTDIGQRIEVILDDAKKEFPKPDTGWADGWVGEDFDADVLAWFKKWFGSE
jgi:hypothetical protein